MNLLFSRNVYPKNVHVIITKVAELTDVPVNPGFLIIPLEIQSRETTFVTPAISCSAPIHSAPN